MGSSEFYMFCEKKTGENWRPFKVPDYLLKKYNEISRTNHDISDNEYLLYCVFSYKCFDIFESIKNDSIDVTERGFPDGISPEIFELINQDIEEIERGSVGWASLQELLEIDYDRFGRPASHTIDPKYLKYFSSNYYDAKPWPKDLDRSIYTNDIDSRNSVWWLPTYRENLSDLYFDMLEYMKTCDVVDNFRVVMLFRP